MKVLHVPFCYYPDPVGGTEVFVRSLCKWGETYGLHSEVAAPGRDNVSYLYNDVRVHRFAVGNPSLRQLHGDGDPVAARNFEGLIQEIKPDIVHFHALTSAVSLLAARAVKASGLRIAFTYHTPTVSCVRGTLMRWGHEICDGALDVKQCASCKLQEKGLPEIPSRLLGALPPSVGSLIESARVIRGSASTALRMTQLTELRHAAFRSFMHEVDHVIAVCEWVKRVLLRNGVSSSKVSLCRQGLAYPITPDTVSSTRSSSTLRVAFLGRVDRVKGLNILLDAMQEVPFANLLLDVYGVIQSEQDRQLYDVLARTYKSDSRVHFRQPLSSMEVMERLREYDLLAVPSQWLETGPLVVYEAFAAGVPVIGSALGGIAELVKDGVDGLLVPANDVKRWAEALLRVIEEPALLPQLKRGIGLVRSMQDCAKDMVEVYSSLFERNARPRQ